MEDLTAGGATDVGPAFREAMKRNPDCVVLATAKGITLDNHFVKQVLDARQGKSAVIHTLDLTSGGDGRSALQEIAGRTKGTYANITPAELRSR